MPPLPRSRKREIVAALRTRVNTRRAKPGEIMSWRAPAKSPLSQAGSLSQKPRIIPRAIVRTPLCLPGSVRPSNPGPVKLKLHVQRLQMSAEIQTVALLLPRSKGIREQGQTHKRRYIWVAAGAYGIVATSSSWMELLHW